MLLVQHKGLQTLYLNKNGKIPEFHNLKVLFTGIQKIIDNLIQYAPLYLFSFQQYSLVIAVYRLCTIPYIRLGSNTSPECQAISISNTCSVMHH